MGGESNIPTTTACGYWLKSSERLRSVFKIKTTTKTKKDPAAGCSGYGQPTRRKRSRAFPVVCSIFFRDTGFDDYLRPPHVSTEFIGLRVVNIVEIFSLYSTHTGTLQ